MNYSSVNGVGEYSITQASYFEENQFSGITQNFNITFEKKKTSMNS